MTAVQNPDVYFVPVPHRVVDEMLNIAQVSSNDVVYDLGCGDGRIVIAAAKSRGARGVGIDIDAELIDVSRANAAAAEVADRVEFLRQDFFETDLREASVLVLYLIDSLNIRLRKKTFEECRAGTRVVTYSFEMGEWEPDAHTPIAANGVFLWIVPANMTGSWTPRNTGQETEVEVLTIHQKFQRISGDVVVDGERVPIRAGSIAGDRFVLVAERSSGEEVLELSGQIKGDTLTALIRRGNVGDGWIAEREMGSKRALE